MARALNRLSARRAETLQEVGRHADGGGLYLNISANGGRRWVFLFRWKGKPTEMGLGSLRDVSLAQARAAASRARANLQDGVSPLDEKRRSQAEAEPAKVITFGDVADELLDTMAPSWKNAKHKAQWEVSLGRVAATRGAGSFATPLRSKPVEAISTEDVLGVLKPIWQTKPETASRLRGRIEAVLDAARAAGHRTSENPARWRGHLDKLLPRPKKLTRGHHAAMPFDDVPAFVAKLRGLHSSSARALEFLILTAGRSGEVLGARWSEVDEATATWTIPGARMKGGREHRVPLTARGLEILAEMKAIRSGDYVFPGAKSGAPLSGMALEMTMRRHDVGHLTPHGFRSAFRDWAGERTTFPREVAEAALAHLVGDETERAYRRGDALLKRRKLMEAWTGFIAKPPAGNVVSLMARAEH